MHPRLPRRFHRDILATIGPRPLTEGLPFDHLRKHVNKGVTMATENQATTVPQGGNLIATDATTFPPQLPSGRLEHRRVAVLTHVPWAGWYCDAAAD